ncbi:hypothetical protein [Flavobacterium croceum]|uniref:hypothetical protein n=1 Tax=Flavobacterium croceum TaxID=370975 RepID=UPI0024A91726|nr:hypothetical protein [Flavobacterium croceum]
MKKVFIVLVLFFVYSCKDSALENTFIYFNQPQPQNVDIVNEIPLKFQGKFSLNFNESIIVKPKCILKEITEDFLKKRTTLDSLNLRYESGYVIEKETGKKHEASIKNDSIYWKTSINDTLFSFANNEIIKVYKSSLILNREINNLYQVNILSFSTTYNKYLQLGTLKDAYKIEKQLHIPREVVMNQQDTAYVLLKPTRADFRKLLRMKEFEFETYYFLK